MRTTQPTSFTQLLFLFLMVPVFLFAQGSNYTEQDVVFTSNADQLHGKLILPKLKSSEKLPVVVFVHGSGDEDYSSSDNYRYLWESFTKIGFACFSWDRPGVGQSTGKWYERTIKDRADELNNAVRKLKTMKQLNPDLIGYWGISQAGWVMSEASQEINPAFIIAVSTAVTPVFLQEISRVQNTMTAAGFSEADKDAAVAFTRAYRELAQKDRPYAEYEALLETVKDAKWKDQVITGNEIVYNYIKAILKDDKSPRLYELSCPVLAIWGENDLVVPPVKSRYFFQLKTENKKNVLTQIIPDADHTLTYNLSGTVQETIKRRQQYKTTPEKIFAPGFVPLMTGWLNTTILKK